MNFTKPQITGYFIKDVKQYAELSEEIGRLTSSSPDKVQIEKIREEYLLELVKRYG